MACGSCAERIQREGPKDSHVAFTRAILFGVGGAILGLVLYSAFAIATGFVIGYLSLAVGYIVAKAMMIGSKGVGGRRYQIVAIVLTYAAVSMSAVPVAISIGTKHRNSQQQARSVDRSTSDPQSIDKSTSEPQSDEQEPPAPSRPRMSFGEALARLALLGLASPFLELQSDGFGGLIGLIILIVGIRIAWKIAQGRSETMVYGPFQNSPPAR